LEILFLLIFAFVISQTAARYVARRVSPEWSQPRLTLLNGFILSLFLFGMDRNTLNVSSFRVPVQIIGIGILIFLVQRLYVLGLKNSEPFISALIMSSIVPISLTTELIFEKRFISFAETSLVLCYVVSVFFKLSTQRKSSMAA
jgi:hypothetical protein